MSVPLLNFEGGPGVLLLNFEGGPEVPLFGFRGSRIPFLNFEVGPILHNAKIYLLKDTAKSE